MGDGVDERVELQVTASVSDAEKKLDSLIKKLDALQDKAGKTSIGASIKGGKNKLQNDLEKALTGSSLNRIEKSMKDFSDARNSFTSDAFNRMRTELEGIDSLARNAGEEYERTAQRLQDAFNDVNYEPVRRRLQELDEETQRTREQFWTLGETIEEAQPHSRMDSYFAFTSQAFDDMRAQWEGATADARTTGEEYERTQERLNEAFSDVNYAPVAARLAELEAQENSVTTTTTTLRDRVHEVGIGFQNVAEGAARIGIEIAGKIGGVAINAFKRLGSAASSTFKTLATFPLKKLQNFTKGFNGLISSIKRIAIYRLLRTAIKEITQGFQEGIKAVYQYSRSLNGEFGNTMDNLSSQLQLLKGSLGAMAAPLIELVAPAIVTVTNYVIGLANAINQLLSLIGGKSSWTKATNAVKAYDDAVGGASKKVDQFTAGIDELNILADNAGGGGGASSDSGIEFEQMGFDTWAESIKSLIDRGKWQDIGEAIANKLNGIVEDWDAEAWGKKLGEKIQHAIEFSYGFWSNLDTETLGTKIGQFFNNVMEAIDTELAGKTFGEKWNRIVELIYGFVTSFEWETLGTKITDWIRGAFESFDSGKLATTLSKLVTGVLSTVSTLFATFPINEMVNSIFDFFDKIEWREIGKSVGTVARELVSTVINGLIQFIDKFDMVDAVIAVTDFVMGVLEAVDAPTLIAKTVALSLKIINGALDILLNVVPAFLESGNPDDFLEKLENSRKTDEIGNKLINLVDEWADGIQERANTRLEGMRQSATQVGDEIVNNVGDYASQLSGIVDETTSTMQNKFGEANAYIYDTSTNTWREIVATGEAGVAEMRQTAVEMGNVVAQPWASFDYLATKAEDTSKRTSDSFNNIQQVTTTSWEQIRNTTESDWNEIQKKVEEVWDALSQKATDTFGESGTITNAVTTSLTIIQEVFTATFIGDNNIANMVQTAFTNMETSILTSTNNAFTTIDNFVEKTINRIDDLIRKLEELERAEESADIDTGGYVGGGYEIGHRAGGGFMDYGQLYTVREGGIPEYVGSYGGRAAVANNDQIVDGIAAGVYQAVASAMGSSNGGNDRPVAVEVYLDGKRIEASVRSRRQRQGTSIASGGIYNNRM